jgi:hypothetical protein
MKNTQKPPKVILLALILVIVVMSTFNYMLDLRAVRTDDGQELGIKLKKHDAEFDSVPQCLNVWGTDHKGNGCHFNLISVTCLSIFFALLGVLHDI